MIKNFILLSSLCISFTAFAQVGINTSNPTSTLDVNIKRNTDGTIANNSQTHGLKIPKLTRAELTASTATYGTEQIGALIDITDISGGDINGQRVNIIQPGIYRFNGTSWVNIDKNLYDIDGTLLSARTVAQADKTLAFTSTATTGTSHFTVDGNTLNVDAVNDRIGIRTSAPSEALHVAGNTYIRQLLKIHGIKQTSTSPMDRYIANFVLGVNGTEYASSAADRGIKFTTESSNTKQDLVATITAGGLGLAEDARDRYLKFNVYSNSNFDDTALIIRGNLTKKTVGIGTTDPQNKLEIKHGTDGNSGLRLTNLKDASYLGTDANGDVVTKTLPAVVANNIYVNDGILSANRTVAQTDKTLAFTGTAVNAFSVDGTTLSVDAANDRVGIGTSTPTNNLEIKAAAGKSGLSLTNLANATYLRTNATGEVEAASAPAINNIYTNDGTISANRTVAQTDKTLAFTGTAVNAFSVDGTTLSVDAANDRVGIGTSTPTNNLEIKAAAGKSGLSLTNLANATYLRTNATGEVEAASAPAINNIYTNDGTILANRTVAQADKTLAFTSNATTGTSHFTVDGNTFNVDAINNRIGIRTSTPAEALQVAGNGIIDSNLKVTGANTDKYITNFNLGKDGYRYANSDQDRGIQFTTESTNTTQKLVATITAGAIDLAEDNKDRYIKLNVHSNPNFNDSPFIIRSYNNNTEKRVGIGTNDPKNRLDIVHGTDGNSGLRLTNLKNASSLSTDGNGDIVSGKNVLTITNLAAGSTSTVSLNTPKNLTSAFLIINSENTCGAKMVSSFIYYGNALSFLSGVAKDQQGQSTLNQIPSSETDVNKSASYDIKFQALDLCGSYQLNGYANQFNFRTHIINTSTSTTISITNNGTVARTYQITLVKI